MRNSTKSPRRSYYSALYEAKKIETSRYGQFHIIWLGIDFKDRATGQVLTKGMMYDRILRQYEIIKHE